MAIDGETKHEAVQATTQQDRLKAILTTAFRLASDLDIRRVVFGKSPRYVLHNRRSDSYYAADPALYRLLMKLDGQKDLKSILVSEREWPDSLSPEDVVGILPALLQHDVVDAKKLPPILEDLRVRQRSSKAWTKLSSVLFWKVDVLQLRRSLPFWTHLIGWVFSGRGVAIWSVMVIAAFWSIAESPQSLGEAMVYLPAISAGQLFVLYGLFIALKLLHELGHAIACVHFAAREGRKVPLIRMGLAIFAGLPFPFTNTSNAWLLRSRWHRAMVGMAGVYLESFVGALVAIAWSFSQPGLLQAVLAQLILVLCVSTFVFNLNPLVRLDGYYILTDLLGLPNLASRSAHAARKALAIFLGAAKEDERFTSGDAGLTTYWITSLAYRCAILAALFWLLYGVDVVLGFAFAALVGLLIAVRPLVSAIAGLVKGAPDPRRTMLRLAASGAALTALIGLVPFDRTIIAEGIVDRPDMREVYASADGFVTKVAPFGTTGRGEPVLILSNPERDTVMRQLELEDERLAIERRTAMRSSPSEVAMIDERRTAIDGQLAELRSEKARQVVSLATNETWYPLAAEALEGMWLRKGDPRSLGVVVGSDARPKIRVFLDQQAGTSLASDWSDVASVPVRLAGRPETETPMRIERVRPAASTELPTAALGIFAGGSIVTDKNDPTGRTGREGLFEMILEPQDGNSVAAAWRHGQRVAARIEQPGSSIALTVWNHLYRLLLQRSIA